MKSTCRQQRVKRAKRLISSKERFAHAKSICPYGYSCNQSMEFCLMQCPTIRLAETGKVSGYGYPYTEVIDSA